MTNEYIAPITLGFTPADGNLIRGTVNGVEVRGEWTGTKKTGGVALKRVDDPDTTICSVGFLDGRTVVDVQSDSAPTTDYELHLYRYVPAGIVQIPQEYVEGLEEAAADATEAKTTAETAQSTANAAKTTAETAQSTANAAKTTAETAQSTANNALTIENGGISKGVIGGTTIKATSSPSTNKYSASLNYQGLYFYIDSADVQYTRIDSNGYSVFGYINTKHITLSPGIDSSVDAYILIESDDTKSVSIRANGEITVVNPDNTLELVGATALIVKSSTPNSTKKFKITVDDAGVISATEVTT